MHDKDHPDSVLAARARLAELEAQDVPVVSSAQIRAARELIGWSSAATLADASQLSLITVRRFEKGGVGSGIARRAMVEALENAGIEFIPRGVRLRNEKESADGP